MQQPDFEGARQYALTRLENDLAAALAYHSVQHTRDRVVPAVEKFSSWEGIQGDDLLLLRTAAWYHDIGFVEQRLNHEATGVRIAVLVLPRFNYTSAQIAVIGGMIMATKLPQAARTKQEGLLADADLSLLGCPDFLTLNNALRAELEAFGMKVSDEQWYRDQLQFLQGHRYWTAAARALCEAGKQRNIAALTQLLAEQDRPA